MALKGRMKTNLKRFALVDENGLMESVSLRDFYAVNDIDTDTANRIGRMQPGDEVAVSGGAAPIFTIRRLS